jgi:hypothetical protein
VVGLSRAEVVRRVGPAVQAYLDADG